MKKQPTIIGFVVIFIITLMTALPVIMYLDNTLPQNLNGDVMYILFSMIVLFICFGFVYKTTQVIKQKIINHG